MQDLGKFSKEQDGYKIEFERVLQHDIQTVWDAITNPERLKTWFTDIEMELKKGSDIKIIFRDESKTLSNGKIIEIDPPHTFIWTWEDELAHWQLEKMNTKSCKLKFIYSKLDPSWAVSTLAGFHTILDRLELALNGHEEYYNFGVIEYDPVQLKLKEKYGDVIYEEYPDLQLYNPLKLEKTYNAPLRKVWAAISDRNQLKKWSFEFNEDFDLIEGHTFDWYGGPPGGKQWLHRGKFIEVQVNNKLIYTWEYPGYEGKAEVIWELTKINESQTKLIFTFKFLKAFDPNEEALKRKNFVAGWNHIVNTGLEEYLII